MADDPFDPRSSFNSYFGWNNKLCHPNSPNGGGGPGGFRQAGPLCGQSRPSELLAHPFSPRGSSVTTLDIMAFIRETPHECRVPYICASLPLIPDTRAFIDYYEKEKPPFGKLSDDQKSGLMALLDQINSDREINDVGWAAYMLATTIHECRSAASKWKITWIPVSESGGENMDYGKSQVITDWIDKPISKDGAQLTPFLPKNHEKYDKSLYIDYKGKHYFKGDVIQANYYGRGFVQITHQENYRAMDDALGLGGKLVVNPDNALDAKIAYDIMSHGMRMGSFRGKRKRSKEKGYYDGHKLSDFINGKKKDYYRARKIINGDIEINGRIIEKYAKTFEKLINLSRVSAYSTGLGF